MALNQNDSLTQTAPRCQPQSELDGHYRKSIPLSLIFARHVKVTHDWYGYQLIGGVKSYPVAKKLRQALNRTGKDLWAGRQAQSGMVAIGNDRGTKDTSGT